MLLDDVRPLTERPVGGDGAAAAALRTRRRWLLVAVLALAGLAVAVASSSIAASAPTERVAISFPDDPNAVESDWGNEEVYGAAGSHVLLYEHGDHTTMRVPWDGRDVAGARLGEAEHNLLTVAGVEQTDEALLLDVEIGNCRYFHERAIDIYTDVTLTLAGGATHVVAFDKPLLVKSPMLASCPDRTLDRGDDARGETFRRGG